MRITKKLLITLLATVVCTVSCKDNFLNVKPTGSITNAQLTSKAGLEGSLIAAYSMLSGRSVGADGFYGGSTNWFWGSVLGGEANKGTNSGDQAQVNEIQAYHPQTGNTSILAKYQATYEGIARVNALLRILPDAQATVTAADKTRIEAEAKFLRAHYYFELKKHFNNTPYIDESVDYSKGIELVKNDIDLWPKIEVDFQFAYDNLPETQGAPGRANKWAAGAYLAKALLFQNKFAAAKTLFSAVIAGGKTANGKVYGLVPKYGNLWRIANNNNEESVFAIQSAAGSGSINNANPDFVLNFPYNGGPAGCCGFFQPSFELANSFRTNAGLPLLDGSYNTGANQLVTDEGVAAKALFTPDAGNLDPRIEHSIGRRYLPYLDHGPHPGVAWIRDQNYGGPYAPKKYIWTKAEEASGGVDKSSWTPGYDGQNVYIIRYADVLLMAAEAEIEAGSLATAQTYINTIRTRAATDIVMGKLIGFQPTVPPAPPGPDYTKPILDNSLPAANYVIANYTVAFGSQAEARTALRFERKLELSGEGQRFYDLVRWGVAAATLNAYLTYEKAQVTASPFADASYVSPKSDHLPIPQREIDILSTAVLAQNPGY
jgi:hypothetical protein